MLADISIVERRSRPLCHWRLFCNLVIIHTAERKYNPIQGLYIKANPEIRSEG